MAISRPHLFRFLAAPAPVALFLITIVAAPAIAYVATRRPPPPVHTVQLGLSTYPATVTALWRDQRGATHTLDPYTDRPVRVSARQVVLAATATSGVQCTLQIDGVTVDTDVGDLAVCSWDQG